MTDEEKYLEYIKERDAKKDARDWWTDRVMLLVILATLTSIIVSAFAS